MRNDPLSRRRFLSGVAHGTLIATIGPALAGGLAAGSSNVLHFGELEPLVRYLQETPLEFGYPAPGQEEARAFLGV